MNKLSSIVLAIAMVFLAQAVVAQNFSVGPRLGVNFTQLVGDDVEADANTAVVFGITSTYSFNESTGLGVDILYSVEGAQGNNDEDLKLGYVRVPVVLQYFFRGLGDNFRPKILAGIVPGFLTKAQFADMDVKEAYNTFDLGGTVGLGFHYRLGEMTWLNTDLRFMRGFSNILDETTLGVYNQNFQLSVGVAFGLQ